MTLLIRCQTKPELVAGVERMTAERAPISSALLGERTWDAVLDMNAYAPAEVESAVAALAGRAVRYVFCSTCSVYQLSRSDPIPEDALTYSCSPDEVADISMATHGARKAECERRLLVLGPVASMAVFIGRPTVVYGGTATPTTCSYLRVKPCPCGQGSFTPPMAYMVSVA